MDIDKTKSMKEKYLEKVTYIRRQLLDIQIASSRNTPRDTIYKRVEELEDMVEEISKSLQRGGSIRHIRLYPLGNDIRKWFNENIKVCAVLRREVERFVEQQERQQKQFETQKIEESSLDGVEQKKLSAKMELEQLDKSIHELQEKLSQSERSNKSFVKEKVENTESQSSVKQQENTRSMSKTKITEENRERLNEAEERNNKKQLNEDQIDCSPINSTRESQDGQLDNEDVPKEVVPVQESPQQQYFNENVKRTPQMKMGYQAPALSPVERVFAKGGEPDEPLERSIEQLIFEEKKDGRIRKKLISELIDLEEAEEKLQKLRHQLGLSPLKYDQRYRDQLMRCIKIFAKSFQIDEAILQEITDQKNFVLEQIEELSSKPNASPEVQQTPSQMEQLENVAIQSMYDRLNVIEEERKRKSKRQSQHKTPKMEKSHRETPKKVLRSPNDPVERGVAKPSQNRLHLEEPEEDDFRELSEKEIQQLPEKEQIEYFKKLDMRRVYNAMKQYKSPSISRRAERSPKIKHSPSPVSGLNYSPEDMRALVSSEHDAYSGYNMNMSEMEQEDHEQQYQESPYEMQYEEENEPMDAHETYDNHSGYPEPQLVEDIEAEFKESPSDNKSSPDNEQQHEEKSNQKYSRPMSKLGKYSNVKTPKRPSSRTSSRSSSRRKSMENEETPTTQRKYNVSPNSAIKKAKQRVAEKIR